MATKKAATKKTATKKAARKKAATKKAATKESLAAKKGKVTVQLSDGEGRVEKLSASPLESDLYRLEESPSFAYSVSVGDIIRARARRKGGALLFESVAEKSGGRTLRLLFLRFGIESSQATPIIETLQRMGCVCDHAQPYVLRVALSSEVSLAQVVEYLKTLAMWWEHADPTHAELQDAND